MASSIEVLHIPNRPMGEDNASRRAELEAKLTPLLYLVLRTGQGAPSLVQWVRLALPVVAPARGFGGSVDPEWAATRLARLLCLQMLQDVRGGRGTTVNRQTVALQ